MSPDYLRDKFTEIEVLKGKLLTYPKECSNDIILKLCMLCDEVENMLYEKKKKHSKPGKEVEKGKGICKCKEKIKHEKECKEKHKEKSKEKHEEEHHEKEKEKDKCCKKQTEYHWNREMLKDLDN